MSASLERRALFHDGVMRIQNFVAVSHTDPRIFFKKSTRISRAFTILGKTEELQSFTASSRFLSPCHLSQQQL